MQRKWLSGALLAFAAILLPGTNAGVAATIFVTSNSGASNVAGACVIRDAIVAANSQSAVGGCTAGTAAGNTIELPPGGSVISLTDVDNSDLTPNTGYGANGLPIVTSSLIIHGNGATIERSLNVACNGDGTQAAGKFRMLMISAPSVEISDATLQNGCADATHDTVVGGTDGGIMVTVDMNTMLLLRRVRLTNNYANYGIDAIGQAAGSLRLEYSTVDHNTGGLLGGTISAANPLDFGCSMGGHVDLRIFNSTIAENGLEQYTIYGCGTAQIENSTVTGNASNPAVHYRAAPQTDGAIKIKNSIIADNTGSSCDFGSNEPDVAASGDNLSSDETCTGFSLPDTVAHLAPLANYGGFTPTTMPLTASAAIDAVSDCTRIDASALTDDQRGATRPLLGRPHDAVRCDIGAVESNGEVIFIAGFE